MSQKNGGGVVAVAAVALMALCCAAPLILVGFAGLVPAVLAAVGSPWAVVAVAAVIAGGLAGLTLWRRSRARACPR